MKISFFVLATSFVALGCSSEPSGANLSDEKAEEAVVEGGNTLEILKNRLIEDAAGWTQDLSRSEGKELFLQNYFDDFSALGQETPFTEKAELTIGSWREIWSSEENPTPPTLKQVKGQVYQIIREDGIGFNIGVRSLELPNSRPLLLTAFIKLAASFDGETELTNVEFLKTYRKQGDLSTEVSLADLVDGILSGTRPDVEEQPEERFPNGPVGAKGSIRTVYVDEDIRIGAAPNAFQPEVTDYFVLQRQDVPLVEVE